MGSGTVERARCGNAVDKGLEAAGMASFHVDFVHFLIVDVKLKTHPKICGTPDRSRFGSVRFGVTAVGGGTHESECTRSLLPLGVVEAGCGPLLSGIRRCVTPCWRFSS